MITDFFKTDSYFIDQKVNFLKFESAYQVFNNTGEKIGDIKQKLSGGQKFLRVLLNKSMLPFRLEVKDINDKILSSINRGWTFFMSKITIKDADENEIGTIKQKFKLLKPKFEIYNTSHEHVATISGDWKAWNFSITNPAGENIGNVSKKWAGAVKEIFTTADKYNVTIASQIAEDKTKVLIVSAAITIDMVLREGK